MLWNELKVDGAGYCATLLAEDEERQRQRDELAEDEVKLEQAMAGLESLPERRESA